MEPVSEVTVEPWQVSGLSSAAIKPARGLRSVPALPRCARREAAVRQKRLPEQMGAARWLLARIRTPGADVRFVYHPPTDPVGLRVIYMYAERGYDIGTLVWRVCSTCRCGSINKISISPEWHRRGLGRRLINRALRDGPGYTWVTSGQSPDARKFFPAITAETRVTFTERGPACPHVTHHEHSASATQPTHRSKPVVERGI
jgi:GNAT superfamily N-acetyltransferase